MIRPRIKLVGIRPPLYEIFDLAGTFSSLQYFLDDVCSFGFDHFLKLLLVKLSFYILLGQVFKTVRHGYRLVSTVYFKQFFGPIAGVRFIERLSLDANPHRVAYIEFEFKYFRFQFNGYSLARTICSFDEST